MTWRFDLFLFCPAPSAWDDLFKFYTSFVSQLCFFFTLHAEFESIFRVLFVSGDTFCYP